MTALITGQIPSIPTINSEKQLTHSVEYWLLTWTVTLLQYQGHYWCRSWLNKKWGELQLLSAHSWLNSIVFVFLLIYGWLVRRSYFFPPISWNVCMEIWACSPWNAIFKIWNWWNQYQYYYFEINGGFFYSRQSHRVCKRWNIQSEDMSGCIGVKTCKRRNLPHTRKKIEKIFPHAL